MALNLDNVQFNAWNTEIPEDVLTHLSTYMSADKSNINVLHFWEFDETYCFVVSYLSSYNDPELGFVRMFKLGQVWQVSFDRQLKFDIASKGLSNDEE